MNISKRDTKMLLILFGIVIFVLCYFLIYLSYTDENNFLIEDIEDAEFEFMQLKAVEGRVAEYEEAIAASEEFILAAQSGYPADVRAADLIMYAVELQENVGIATGGITFIQPVDVMTVRGLEANANGTLSFIQRNAYRTGINMSVSLTYQQLKDLVDYVYNVSAKASVNSISVSYNSSTGLLYGNVVIHKNFLSSEDSEYVAAQIPDMRTGLPNPFGVARPAPRQASPESDPAPEPE
jgi:hypothetical protein